MRCSGVSLSAKRTSKVVTSLSAGRSRSRLFPHDASTAVTAVNHPPRSPLALWQAVNGYHKPHHASTLRTITNLSLSPCVFCSSLCLSSLAGVRCHVRARDGGE